MSECYDDDSSAADPHDTGRYFDDDNHQCITNCNISFFLN